MNEILSLFQNPHNQRTYIQVFRKLFLNAIPKAKGFEIFLKVYP